MLTLLFAGSANASTPARVLSLDLCSDWILARHAPQSQVLALSPYGRQYPVDWLGKDWPRHDGSLEQILSLQPDLVITGEFNALTLRRRLESLGVRVAVLPLPQSLADIRDYETRILALLGLPASRADILPPSDPGGQAGKRLLLLGANGIGTGTKTFEHDVLTHAGWQNYLQAEGYVSLDLEKLVSDPPDAVAPAAPQGPALANRFTRHPALRRAVPADRWLAADDWRWRCPGPWTYELIGQLKQWRD